MSRHLRPIDPTHVVTQIQCEVCAVSYRTVQQAARRLDTDATVISLEPSTISDIMANIHTIADLTNTSAKAERVVADLRDRLAVLQGGDVRLGET